MVQNDFRQRIKITLVPEPLIDWFNVQPVTNNTGLRVPSRDVPDAALHAGRAALPRIETSLGLFAARVVPSRRVRLSVPVLPLADFLRLFLVGHSL